MIVVLAASVLVSATLRQASISERALRRALALPHQLIISRAVDNEYQGVLSRPKLDRFARLIDRRETFAFVVTVAQRIEPAEQVQECADPKDNKYVSLAAAGNADVIVSSDLRNLVAMHPWRGIPILRSADYLALP